MYSIKSVDVISFAKIMAAVHGCLSLVFVPFFLIAALISFAAGGGSNAVSALGMGAMGLVFAVVLPFVYTAIGFLIGALMAWIYNLVARKIGGISFELTGPSITQVPNAVAPTV
jgi:hypothetical protein